MLEGGNNTIFLLNVVKVNVNDTQNVQMSNGTLDSTM